MRRIRLFHEGELSSGLTVILQPETSHHLLQVLRKKIGETLWLFNNGQGDYEAVLTAINKKSACVKVGNFFPRNTESSLHIHLGQAISRGERMDYAIQKAVELGVAEITPLFTEFCQVKLAENRIDKRVLHWQMIAVSAAEQSGRCVVPIVHEPVMFDDWLQQTTLHKIICCPKTDKNDFVFDASIQSLSVSIGAEGGFSAAELERAFLRGFKAMPLGPRILRTETATVVAMTLLQQLGGDFTKTGQ